MSIISKFKVTLSQAYNEIINVDYATRDNTAIAGDDYQAESGQLLFAIGETEKEIDILVFDRASGSPDISFYVDLSATTNAVIGDSTAECIISVDSAGALSVYNFSIPTGPDGPEGKSAYQVAVDNGFVGTVEQWLDSLNGGTPLEIAEQVAPLVNFNETYCTSQGTFLLAYPDSPKMKTLARRLAYAGPAKVASRLLSAGDNTFPVSGLAGSVVNPDNITFYLRFFRNGERIELDWSYDEDQQEITVLGATADDFAVATEYDLLSEQNIKMLRGLQGYNVIPVIGTSHVVTAEDSNAILVFDTNSAVTLTVPQTSTEDLPPGFRVNARNKRDGVITIQPEGSDVVVGAGTATVDAKKLLTVYRESTGVWVSIGDLS